MQMTVGALEGALFAAFPHEDAQDWDNIGLAVGDRSAEARRIAVALDMTADNVIAADESGCNVLVTHHPPFIAEGPKEFGPQDEPAALGPGRAIYEAVRRGIACIDMHTNADRSPRLRAHYAALLGYPCTGSYEALSSDACSPDGPGLGAVLEPPEPVTLAELVSRVDDAFGSVPRVWGDPEQRLGRIAVLNGSWGSVSDLASCMVHGVDCVVVGESRYHSCLDVRPHLAVIEAGHDASELPIVDLLAQTLEEAGIDAGRIARIQMRANWWTPEKGE